MFCDLPAESLVVFDAIGFANLHPRCAVLFVGGAILTTGSRDRKSLIVRLAEQGEVLGLSAALFGDLSPLTTETIASCQANFVKREDFLWFLREYPEVYLPVIEMLGQILQSG